MRSALTNAVSAGALLLLLLVSLASADRVRLCTAEEEAMYKPYDDKANAPECHTLYDFKTCTDTCLVAYEDDARHAPNCTDGSPGRGNTTFLKTAEAGLKLCKDARADTTDKCTGRKDATCSDECLKIIENKITNAPVCTKDDDVFTLGERDKSDLARCLTARKEDLKSNKVLMTVATASGEAVLATMPPSSPTASAVPPTASAATAVISVVVLAVAAMV